MGKASKSRKKARAAVAAPYVSARLPTTKAAAAPFDSAPADVDMSSESDDLDPIDLITTLDTLTFLLDRPALLKSAENKPLRTLIYKLHGVLHIGGNVGAAGAKQNPEGELIVALRNGDHPRARELLAGIKQPKLGSLQRWVRECDAANVADPSKDPEAYKNDQNETWKTLDAIIRTTMPPEAKPPPKQTLVRFDPWEVERKADEQRVQVYRQVQQGTLASPDEADYFKGSFRVLTTIAGPDRKPPNLHPAIIWTSAPNAIPTPLAEGPVVKHAIPDIPNALILQNVLSPDTCRRIIAAGETLGFTPDQAAAGSATELASVLAHNFYWMADEAFNDALLDRVRPHLPPTVAGCPLRTINRRYRTYRYVPGAVYRPHVDGAWPPSGIAQDGTYVYDATAGCETRQYSRFTFLVYLNDEFAGGETTFFVPGEEGLCARPVRPTQGCVVVFPHGDTVGSLVHEGSGVKEGAKYIIRTDVVYDIPKTGRAAVGA